MEISAEARDHWTRGTCCFAQRDFKGALADFNRALESDPRYAEAWNNRGATRMALGDHAAALADFDRAIELHPDYAEAYHNRGFVRQAVGDLSGAVADFDRSIELNPNYAEALSNRGAARHALANFAGAIQDFDRALAIAPDNPDTWFRRGSARLALGDHPGAIDDYTHVLELLPRQAAAPVYHDRGAVHFALRNFAAAVADFDQAIAIDPQYGIAYVSRGNARYHLRDPAGLSDYLTALRINPQRAASEIIRILTSGLREDPEGVLENCRQHVRICPDDIAAYVRRGLTLVLQGKDAEAELDFQQALRRSPTPNGKAILELLIAAARRRLAS